MQYDKTIRDDFGDDVQVAATDGGYVYTEATFRDEECQMAYTPSQARHLARALKRAANVAEGKPAKKPKPAVIIDGDGDDWHLSPNGKYSLDAPDEGAERNRAYIRLVYGIREERA